MTDKRDYMLLLAKSVLNIVIIIYWLIAINAQSLDNRIMIALLIGQIYALLSYDINCYRFFGYSILFMAAAYFIPQTLPLVALSFIYTRHLKWTTLLAFLLLIVYAVSTVFSAQSLVSILLSSALFIFSLLKMRYQEYRLLYEKQRDETQEVDFIYRSREEQIKQLVDSKASASVLAERNRIAGELHDHIGHTISSAIVQAEAYKAMYLEADQQADIATRQTAIESIIKTLKDGMIDIRSSLHHLRDQSLDFKAALEAMQQKYPSLELSIYLYQTEQMPYNMKTQLIRVVSEVLANAVKHSDATQLKISIVKQQHFYSFIAKDNGTKQTTDLKLGMGLDNIKAIADSYHGNFSYGFQDGFFIHMTLYVTED